MTLGGDKKEQKKNGKPEKSKIKDPSRWRDLTAYWILGLCNNYGYVVMLSAAHDIIGRFSGEEVSSDMRLSSVQGCTERTGCAGTCCATRLYWRGHCLFFSSIFVLFSIAQKKQKSIRSRGEYAISFRPAQFYWLTSFHHWRSNWLFRSFHFSYSKCLVLQFWYLLQSIFI